MLYHGFAFKTPLGHLLMNPICERSVRKIKDNLGIKIMEGHGVRQKAEGGPFPFLCLSLCVKSDDAIGNGQRVRHTDRRNNQCNPVLQKHSL